jgi:hypothetical protein
LLEKMVKVWSIYYFERLFVREKGVERQVLEEINFGLTHIHKQEALSSRRAIRVSLANAAKAAATFNILMYAQKLIHTTNTNQRDNKINVTHERLLKYILPHITNVRRRRPQ